MNNVEDEDADFNQIINMYIESYIKGMEIMRMLRVSYAAIYEDVYNLEQVYKSRLL